ncbi:hypothetical protein L1279_001875 [Planomicrobium sp. HSC-17F08]|nr:hypothetical protein [Planomicrobium sp. HSC-17F08]
MKYGSGLQGLGIDMRNEPLKSNAPCPPNT